MPDPSDPCPISPGASHFTPVLNCRYSAFALFAAFLAPLTFAWSGIPAMALSVFAMVDFRRFPGRRKGLPSALFAFTVGLWFTFYHSAGMETLAQAWDRWQDLLEVRAILLAPSP